MKEKIKQFFMSTKLWILAHKTVSIIGLVVLVVILLVIFKKGTVSENPYTVAKQNVVQAASLSGTVSAVDASDLSFADGGRVAAVYVKEGDAVRSGQVLARLDAGDLYAELSKAQAAARGADVEVRRAQTYLDNITKEQNALVDSNLQTMHSEGLIAVNSQSSNTITPPVITGLYNGEPGEYKISIDRYGAIFGNYSVRTFELEKTEPVKIEKNMPTKLGTKGLFIEFPDELSDYNDSTWYVAIPNKSSNLYAANYNAYQEALRTRDRVIADAKESLAEAQAKESSGALYSGSAQADIMAINAQINRRSIHAPFAGLVGVIEAKVGESVSASDAVVHLVGTGQFQIALSVPELDIAAFEQGQKVGITFDAIKDQQFTGSVLRVSPSESEQEGVSVYQVFVIVDNPTDEIRSGLTARVTLETQIRENVLAIPTYYVQFGKGAPRVRVLEGKKTIIEKEVTIGLRGTNGLIEITTGLNENDVVIPFPVVAYAS